MLIIYEVFSIKLFQAGVDVNVTDVNGNSAVHYAYWNKKILGLLVKAGASLNHLNKMQQSLLHVPVGDGRCIDTVTPSGLGRSRSDQPCDAGADLGRTSRASSGKGGGSTNAGRLKKSMKVFLSQRIRKCPA